MGNPLKGAVRFDRDGHPEYLSYSAEALYHLERELGEKTMNLIALFQDQEKFDMKTLRTVFWAGLLDTHPELELEDVGPFFRCLGAIEAMTLVSRAVTGAFVDTDAPQAQGTATGPRTPDQALTGTGSAS
jgi:hypothetical protein